MSEQMKAVVFEGVTYRVPVWVNWMARDQDGDIWGYDSEPEKRERGYINMHGDSHSVYVSVKDESWRNSAARV